MAYLYLVDRFSLMLIMITRSTSLVNAPHYSTQIISIQTGNQYNALSVNQCIN